MCRVFIFQQGVYPTRIKPLPIKANLDLWTYNARQFILKGNFTGAELLYKKCIEYDPTDGRSWLGLARICWKKGQALKYVLTCIIPPHELTIFYWLHI